ncbi:hypothetical protein ACHAWO_010492 [Cyclotella atomus]|uniref:Chitin-binding type-2 domain-containing protein n=1 Tax=Cyclotella atomus TaxID=382360 RepID=A0ABD3Q769_9STRA
MNQPLHQSLSNLRTRRRPVRARRRTAHCIILAALTASALVTAQDVVCPPGKDGWAASSDCRQYYWCSAGTTSGMVYTCPDSTEYNIATSVCENPASFECSGTASTVNATGVPQVAGSISPGDQLAAMTEAILGDANETDADGGDNETEVVLGNETDATPSPFAGGTAPTNYPTKLGPPLYYGDFRTSSCLSAAADPTAIGVGVGVPSWLTEDLMYQSKEECCEDMFGWAPLDNCLGDNWVETNYVRGSRSPTMTPTLTPTSMPSGMPSVTLVPSSAPTVVASEVPSSIPSYASSSLPSLSPSRITMAPTLIPTSGAPTTLFPTLAPTETIVVVEAPSQDGGGHENIQDFSSNPEYGNEEQPISSGSSFDAVTVSSPQNAIDPSTFLVELLGWANSDYSPGDNNSRPTKMPTKKPTSDSFAISEIILPIVEDATVSLQRKNLNFGANSALAVDGGMSTVHSQGDGLGERFDSLLKFDVGMIDHSRPVEKAVLRIYALAECMSGGTFVTTTDSIWDQESVTWETSPLGDGYEIGTIGSVKQNTWYELDMLPALAWNDSISPFSLDSNLISIRISSSTSSRCMYSAMESGQAKAPYMSVRYGMSDVIQEFSSQLNEPPVSGQFLLLRSTDDATLDGANPVANLGTDTSLKVSFDLSTRGISDALIRFDLSEIAGAVPVSAVLSLYAETECVSAGNIMTTEGGSSWSEKDVTWSTAPAYKKEEGGGFNLGTFGHVSPNKWYGFDVVQAVQYAVEQGNTDVTFRISTATDGECVYSSRESGRDPKMMVAF